MIFTNIFQQLKNNDNSLYFRFWANCIFVKGHRKSIVYDLQRERIIYLSNLFFETYQRYKNIDIKSIYADSKNPNRIGFLKIANNLIDNDFGILVDNPKTLPPLITDYDSPLLITNAIIKTDSSNPELLYNSIKSLSNLRIQALRIDDHSKMNNDVLKKLDDLVRQSSCEQIYIRTNFSSYFDKMEYQLSFRFRQITYYNAPADIEYERKDNSDITIKYSSKSINYKDCGNVEKKYFTINLPFFTEAQHHNTCLNRKICIDANGEIKNCPAMTKSYGNIRDITLKEAINKPGFKDLWFICKDQIDVCKDCEFRYMCTDCRCFIKDPENIYSQPAKCTYNPYICLWEGQEGYVPVEECGTYSRKTGFVPDKKRINELNRKIWGEE
ncbi:MAG: grasp-with-spasm system SPASM domain peptide maturase [Bacteroidales bacterium]|nr:grasp-with-spasm system SPASM domain peptide maturase [Bacteroidales bacterium]